jgi:hypothetical protein
MKHPLSLINPFKQNAMNTIISPSTVYDITPEHVKKELLYQLKFPKDEVLKDNNLIINRLHSLQLATVLGNIDHQKISIVFQDNIGLKKVTTTIWSTCDTHIILKGGASIPINRIWSINVYHE